MIFKNVSGQGVYFSAFDADGDPVLDDEANITATISKDGAAPAATATTNPTEIGGGLYWLPLSQAETNANQFAVAPVSATADVTIDPIVVSTTAGAIPLVAFGTSGGLPVIGTSPLTNLDALISSRMATFSYTAPDNAGISTLLTRLTALRAGYLDNLATAPPTVAAIAEGVLLFDWTDIIASVPAYCLLNAARWLRNRWGKVGSNIRVYEEDETATAWERPIVTDADQEPIVGLGAEA